MAGESGQSMRVDDSLPIECGVRVHGSLIAEMCCWNCGCTLNISAGMSLSCSRHGDSESDCNKLKAIKRQAEK
jgi:hypothetical protein